MSKDESVFDNIIDFEDIRQYKAFIEGNCSLDNSCTSRLYDLLRSFIEKGSENVSEKQVSTLLIDLNKLNAPAPTKKYIEYLKKTININGILEGINNKRVTSIYKREDYYNPYEKEISVLEKDETIVFKLVKFFNNVISRPFEMTVFDVDFILIGLIQETFRESTYQLLDYIIKSASNYTMKIDNDFKKTMVFKIYGEEHSSYVEENVKTLHGMNL